MKIQKVIKKYQNKIVSLFILAIVLVIMAVYSSPDGNSDYCSKNSDCLDNMLCKKGSCEFITGNNLSDLSCISSTCTYETICSEKGVDNCGRICNRDTANIKCNDVAFGERVLVRDGVCNDGFCKATCSINTDCGLPCPQGEPDQQNRVLERGCFDGLCDCQISMNPFGGTCMVPDKYGIKYPAPDGTICGGDYIVGICINGECKYDTLIPDNLLKKTIEFKVSLNDLQKPVDLASSTDCIVKFPQNIDYKAIDECRIAAKSFQEIVCACKYTA